MLFGWQGFSLEHPEDWSPVTLTGTRSEGYACIASPGRSACQIRWKHSRRAPDLDSRLTQYFDRLRRDSKKGQEFFAEREASEDRLLYRYRGQASARGGVFYSEACRRVFFIELVSTGRDSLLGAFRSVMGSFRSDAEPLEPWAFFGLSVRLPSPLVAGKPTLLSGKSSIPFRGKGVRLRVERWGLADQLVKKHGLEAWSRGVTGLRSAESLEEHDGIRLVKRGRALMRSREAIIQHQREQNQIVLVAAEYTKAAWSPKWEWIA